MRILEDGKKECIMRQRKAVVNRKAETRTTKGTREGKKGGEQKVKGRKAEKDRRETKTEMAPGASTEIENGEQVRGRERRLKSHPAGDQRGQRNGQRLPRWRLKDKSVSRRQSKNVRVHISPSPEAKGGQFRKKKKKQES